MADSAHYVIRGGVQGRERLRVLSRVMRPYSGALFDRLNLRDGLACLDAGCGGGDATLELARRVGPGGSAVGIDLDETKIAIARREAEEQGVTNVTFNSSNVCAAAAAPEFDVVYARFLLTHLSDPAAAVRALCSHLRPGGWLAVEDIDFSGHFTYPRSPAFERYHELYCATVAKRGGDPNIGPRLPLLLKQNGCESVAMDVVQPSALEGDAKLLNPMTMENIAGAVLDDGLATGEEIDDLTRALYAFAADPDTVAGMPRIVQCWGRRPPKHNVKGKG
jgi:predicted O-methyltransferase YrrM